MILGKTFYFDSAHHLPGYEGACKANHGHTFRLDVLVKGEIDKTGMVMDYKHLKKIVNENIIDILDHNDLNNILDNPTSENLIEWIWNKLKDKLPLYKLRLYEQLHPEQSFCEYRGE